MLICVIVNSALSCCECFLPTDAQYAQLDRLIAGLARKAMMGAATKQEGEKFKAMTIGQVLQYWRLTTAKLEALVRRLSWMQEVTNNPANHKQYIAAVFGKLGRPGGS